MADKYALFRKEYRIRGRFEQYARNLAGITFDKDSQAKVFNSGVELFKTAAIVGLINNRREKPENGTTEFSIFPEQLGNHYRDLMFIFQTMMLTYDNDQLTPKERINNAFRYSKNNDSINEENFKIFEEFMLGGLCILHEVFFNDGNNRYDDYLASLKKLVDSFSDNSESEEETFEIGDFDDFQLDI